MSVTFADEQAAYLAGAAAAMLARQTGMPGISGRKIIGWITGEDCPAMRSLLGGFTEGARVIDPEVRVVNVVTGSFANAEAGRAAAKNLLDQGADILVLASGMLGESSSFCCPSPPLISLKYHSGSILRLRHWIMTKYLAQQD